MEIVRRNFCQSCVILCLYWRNFYLEVVRNLLAFLEKQFVKVFRLRLRFNFPWFKFYFQVQSYRPRHFQSFIYFCRILLWFHFCSLLWLLSTLLLFIYHGSFLLTFNQRKTNYLFGLWLFILINYFFSYLLNILSYFNLLICSCFILIS